MVLVIAVAISFFAGMQYQKSQNRGQFNMRQGNSQINSNRQMIRGVSGEVLNVNDKTMTVKLNDGSSKIVMFLSNTSVSQATSSAVSNIKTGEQVMVFGANNSDGSVNAQTIQINPIRPQGQGG